MTALAFNKQRTYAATRPDAHRDMLVEAAAEVFQGAALGLDGGYVQPLAAGDVFVGFAEAYCDNSGGSDGDKSVRVIQRGILRGLSVTGISAVSDFTLQQVFMSDDDTFTTSAAGNTAIGQVIAVNADGTCDVEFDAGSASAGATWYESIGLHTLRETSNLDVGNIAANGGLLASDTTPVLDAINAATDGCQRVLWASSNNDQVTFQLALPPNLDPNADITVRFRIASGGTTNAVGFTLASYFNEGDTAVADTSGTNQTTSYTEVTATIAAADIPSDAQTLTIGLTPVAHTTDTMACSMIRVEGTLAAA